jgi:ElaA protein
MTEITTEWRSFDELTTGELYELLRFRQNIFVVEQRSPYPDLDGLDESAWHLAARLESELIGYLRLTAMTGTAPPLRIGRVAVAVHLRRQGLGRTLIKEALRFSGEHYSEGEIALGAQAHLVPFYQGFGFETSGAPYDEFGISHTDMRMRLSDFRRPPLRPAERIRPGGLAMPEAPRGQTGGSIR